MVSNHEVLNFFGSTYCSHLYFWAHPFNRSLLKWHIPVRKWLILCNFLTLYCHFILTFHGVNLFLSISFVVFSLLHMRVHSIPRSDMSIKPFHFCRGEIFTMMGDLRPQLGSFFNFRINYIWFQGGDQYHHTISQVFIARVWNLSSIGYGALVFFSLGPLRVG